MREVLSIFRSLGKHFPSIFYRSVFSERQNECQSFVRGEERELLDKKFRDKEEFGSNDRNLVHRI